MSSKLLSLSDLLTTNQSRQQVLPDKSNTSKSHISQNLRGKEAYFEENTKYLAPRQKELATILAKSSSKRTQAETEKLIPIIQKIQFFKEREISNEHYVNIAESLSYEYYPAEQIVFYQGDPGDKFYIIIEGEVSIKIFNRGYDVKKKELTLVQNNLKRLNKQKNNLLEKVAGYAKEMIEIPDHVELEMREVKDALKIKEGLFAELEA